VAVINYLIGLRSGSPSASPSLVADASDP
jgi:hypothetical protein